MRHWLAANLFLFGMGVLVAALLVSGLAVVRFFDLPPTYERIGVAVVALASIFGSGLIARALLRRIDRR